MIPTTRHIGIDIDAAHSRSAPAGIVSVRRHVCSDVDPHAVKPAKVKKPPKPAKPKKPREPWGKVAEMRAWYTANPLEQLTFEDITRRFDITTKRAYAIASVLRAEGLICSEMVTYLNPERPR